MKLLDNAGLSHLVRKIMNLFQPLWSFNSNIKKVNCVDQYFIINGGAILFNISEYFIDGITVNNSEIIFELVDYGYQPTYRLMDSMRITSYEAMSGNSFITVLKSGWCYQPGQGDSQSASVSIGIQGGQVKVSGNVMGGYSPQLRVYVRKFRT